MARIYKITAYIVDPNEVYENGEDCFAALIDRSKVYCPVPVKHEEAQFEWNENLPINWIGCEDSDCEAYFNKGDKV